MEIPAVRDLAGLAVGALSSPAVATVSGVRRARMFHPEGETFLADVAPSRDVSAEFRDLADRLHGFALARFSGALWRGGFEHLDVLGIALRFRTTEVPSTEPSAGDQDLLFATIRSPFTMPFAPFTTRANDYFANTYWAVSPFAIGSGHHVKFRMRPPAEHAERRAGRRVASARNIRLEQAVADGGVAWELEARRTFSRAWSPLATILLTAPARVDEEALRFSAYRCGRGIAPRGFVHAMRRPAYAASQWARPSHS